MVGVCKCTACHLPCRVPFHLVFIHQQAHQLRNGNRRMRVIELDGPLFMEFVERPFLQQVYADHVPKRAGDEKVLLLKAQRLALHHLIIGVEHLGDVLRMHLALNRAVVVALIECGEIERLNGFGLPEPHRIARAHAIAQDRRVIRNTPDHARGDPAHPISPLVIGIRLGVATEPDLAGDLRPDDLPWVTEPKPLVSDLDLPAIMNDLIKDAKLIANAVPDGRDLGTGQ